MKKNLLAAMMVPVLVAGCGSLTKVDSEGNPVGDLVWPNPENVTLDHHRGTYGDMNRIGLLKNGATRDDIYELIGRPQFSEGFRVNEWNYLFYFTQQDGTELTCEFKVLFDKNKYARNFYWKTISPEGAHCPPAQKMTLSADALFRFDGGYESDLLPSGVDKLSQLAAQLKDAGGVKAINIMGYTDRIGSEEYNQALSAQRAQTVGNYLISHGVSPDLIRAEGFGEANPVVECTGNHVDASLIQCLQPNRRVDVEVVR